MILSTIIPSAFAVVLSKDCLMPRFTNVHEKRLDSRLRGIYRLGVIPAKAGIQRPAQNDSRLVLGAILLTIGRGIPDTIPNTD